MLQAHNATQADTGWQRGDILPGIADLRVCAISHTVIYSAEVQHAASDR